MRIERHKMRVNRRFPTGAEEWVCPQCGRRMVLASPPGYQRVLVEVGNAHALHYGNFARRWEVEEDGQGEQRPQLSPLWLEALAELDFGDWPDGRGG